MGGKKCGNMTEWISVDDNLPIRGQLVLANSTDLVTKDCTFYLARFDGKYWAGEGTYLFGRVTHWMPLPSKPNYSA